MDARLFDSLIKRLHSRRGALGLAAGVGTIFAVGEHDEAEAKKLCRKNGTSCKKTSRRCQRKYCLSTPFTIEARWSSSDRDHDAILFVPNEPGSNGGFPYIAYDCLASDTNNGTLYPFAFMSGDAQGPGNEIATVQRLLADKYEFWARIHGPAAVGDLTVIVRGANGKVLRTWENPPNANSGTIDWHVFDIDGTTHSIAVSGELVDNIFTVRTGNTIDACPT